MPGDAGPSAHRPLPLLRRALLASLTLSAVVPRAVADPPNAISAEAALDRLMQGNTRYAANQPNRRDLGAERQASSTAQYPIAAILGCADSRVAPEYVFDQGLGDLFVVRIAGNVLTEAGTASLEFAVATLNVPLILVLGHANCGAVATAIRSAEDGTPLAGHLPDLIGKITPAVIATHGVAPPDRLAAAIAENVRLTCRQISATAPVLAPMVASGKVKIAGGVYDLTTGQVRLL